MQPIHLVFLLLLALVDLYCVYTVLLAKIEHEIWNGGRCSVCGQLWLPDTRPRNYNCGCRTVAFTFHWYGPEEWR